MLGIFLLLASAAYAALTSCPATATRVAAVPPLAEWVASQGGDVSVVQAADAAQLGVGLVAARAVRRGDRLLSVPEELAITAESALRSELLGAYLVEFEPYLADYSFIAVALLNEERLGEQSSLAPWLSSACWQVEQHDLPLLWPSDDQAELEQSTAAPCVERRLAAQADYEWLRENVFEASPMVFPESVFSEASFLRALGLAFSRCVFVPAGGRQGEPARPALLPLVELCNHADSPSASLQARGPQAGLFGRGGEGGAVELTAQADLSAGDALTLCYAEATRGELLLDYGFVAEPVPPEASLRFGVADDDPNYDEKARAGALSGTTCHIRHVDVLERVGLSAVEQGFVVSEADPLPPDLLAYLRLALFADDLWREHLQQPVSRQNEAAALQLGHDAVTSALGKLRGDVQLDLASLAEAPRESVGYRCAAVRYAERRAVSAAANELRAALGSLDGLEYYQERRLKLLNLTPVETEEELEALRSAGRRTSDSSSYDW
ncbi:hypothetical protein EMIHUDRAFT_448733 [Emiliania huxleyi CCMP1516]|uniref:Rubisco LSMT substrate-binding domain-containing protein n=2 Tax=Emiliania huxleyi TaxID=2903 RepID=A0A0D3KZQ9_EMIH1|nr:hypothetical protein EMIHUDRAFT_448733 [Emiliania huxleyi CCMP1516]EOD41244.1 hypothetical protein EMIHUDRAFT_448733 [Emiliania huxleyi CCMP1516]|eukprot:XP_005793673.1 hypothetical protein EMIHUDRAFT_448733 [Emiliania huxleyi CCMP1516]